MQAQTDLVAKRMHTIYPVNVLVHKHQRSIFGVVTEAINHQILAVMVNRNPLLAQKNKALRAIKTVIAEPHSQ